jgi:hypothetical protein
VGFRAVLRAARATFRPVLRAVRATFRPVLRAARATFRPVLRAVRAVLRVVVFLVAIVFLPFCFDVAICPFGVGTFAVSGVETVTPVRTALLGFRLHSVTEARRSSVTETPHPIASCKFWSYRPTCHSP